LLQGIQRQMTGRKARRKRGKISFKETQDCGKKFFGSFDLKRGAGLESEKSGEKDSEKNTKIRRKQRAGSNKGGVSSSQNGLCEIW